MNGGYGLDYSDLVRKVQEYYTDSVHGGFYTKKDKKLNKTIKDEFRLKWCDECKEINLWTYWQGHKNKKAKILLLGQDWASPWDLENRKLLDYVLQDDEGCSQRYIESLSSPTDKMLQKLMVSLGEEYDPFKPDNENLFFTNLCLGYRDHGSSSGLDRNALLHDVEYTKELISIIEPKIIICLGKDTYDAMVQGTNSVPVSEEKSFYKKLAEGKCYATYDGRIPIYGQAHPGPLGVMNRRRYHPSVKERIEKSAEDILIEDWKKVIIPKTS